MSLEAVAKCYEKTICLIKRMKNNIVGTQLTFTYLKSTIETLEKGVKYVQI